MFKRFKSSLLTIAGILHSAFTGSAAYNGKPNVASPDISLDNEQPAKSRNFYSSFCNIGYRNSCRVTNQRKRRKDFRRLIAAGAAR